MPKKQFLTRIRLFTVIAAILSWPVLASFSRSRELRVLWKNLQNALEDADQTLIYTVLADSESDLHEIRGARVFYLNMDYTAKIINMEVIHTQKHSAMRPLSYEYFTDPNCENKGTIEFREGYALTENGKITFLKFF